MSKKEKRLDWTYIHSESDIPTHGGQVLVSWGFTKDFRNGGPFVDQARWEKAYGWTFGHRKANDLFIYAWRDLPKAAAWQNEAESLPAATEQNVHTDLCGACGKDAAHQQCPMADASSNDKPCANCGSPVYYSWGEKIYAHEGHKPSLKHRLPTGSDWGKWTSCENADGSSMEGKFATPVSEPVAPVEAQDKEPSFLPPLGDRSLHFEDKDVVSAMVGSDYLIGKVKEHLMFMTTGEKWSLYRAIVELSKGVAEPKPTPSTQTTVANVRNGSIFSEMVGGPQLKPQPDSSSIPEIELELRRMMWLGHGHTGMYGDDGEMQCGECRPFGVVDYKREPLDKVRETFRAVQMERIMKPRDSSSISTERTFEEWWAARPETNFGWTKRVAYDAWAAAKGQR